MGSNTETYTKTFSIDLERANYHYKCKKRKKKRLFIVLCIWAIVFTYLFTPLSRVNLKVEGNIYYDEHELLSLSHIDKNDYWWLVDTKKAKKVLEINDFISSVSFSKSFFGTKLIIEEIYPVGIKNNKYVLSNSNLIEKEDYMLNSKITSLTDLNNVGDADLSNFINQYKNISLDVRNHFNKVEIVKADIGDNEFYNYVKLFGNDNRIGNYVIKVDMVYLNTKFNGNKYDKIMEEISKNNVKYEEEPALIAYHHMNEEEFELVENFEEE